MAPKIGLKEANPHQEEREKVRIYKAQGKVSLVGQREGMGLD